MLRCQLSPFPTGAGSLCSGGADQKVKTWDVRRGACTATVRLDGAVSALTAAAADHAVPLLCVTDEGALHCADPRAKRGVVQSLKPGAKTAPTSWSCACTIHTCDSALLTKV